MTFSDSWPANVKDIQYDTNPVRRSESWRHNILIHLILATKILSGYQIKKRISPCSHLLYIFGDRFFHPQAESRRTTEKRDPLKTVLQEYLGEVCNYLRTRHSSGRHRSDLTMQLDAP